MVCPFCLHKKTHTYNSRPSAKLNSTWRRRECLKCKRQFTTYERADPSEILTVKAGRNLIPFSRSKLLISLIKTCDHLKDSDETIFYLASNIEQKLYLLAAKSHNQTITREDIVSTTSNVLHKFDPLAYVKYIGKYMPNMKADSLRKALKQKPEFIS